MIQYSSGIGRAVAIIFAREGADITIVFLPEEKEDAEDTKKSVEKEGKKCLLVPGDLMENSKCKEAVDKHVKECVKFHSSWRNWLIHVDTEKSTSW